jgi:hypothetical protein
MKAHLEGKVGLLFENQYLVLIGSPDPTRNWMASRQFRGPGGHREGRVTVYECRGGALPPPVNKNQNLT